eukprot:COSAG01_NODE_4149_length_5293_cov_71.856180_3_plen_133_part_00
MARFYGYTDAQGVWQAAGTSQPGSRGVSDELRISTVTEFQRSLSSLTLNYVAYLNDSIDGYAARPGESFMCVYWVAVPKALRARRVNSSRAHGDRGGGVRALADRRWRRRSERVEGHRGRCGAPVSHPLLPH